MSGGSWLVLGDVARTVGLRSRKPRAGLVRAEGRKIVDDAGAFFPLGVSFFCALWGWKHDRDRARRSFAFLAEHDADYYRALFEVGGGSWADRTIDPRGADYEDNAIDMVETAWNEFGLRVEPTVFAGGTGADPDLVTDKLRRIFESRQHVVISMEGANEAFQNFPDHALLRRQVQKIRSWFRGLVATSSPQNASPELFAEYTSKDFDVANFFTVHTERSVNDGGWRAVRQPWDAWPLRMGGSNNEPPGLQSSGAMLSDPLRLAMLRAIGIMCGVPAFVLHTGAGVRWGGAADLATGTGKDYLPRKANFWEYDNFSAICRALRQVDALVPADAPNWTKTRHGADHTDHPLRTDDIWPDGLDHGVVRIHAAYGGGRFVVMPIGVKKYADLHARDACRITVSDPLTGATLDERTLAAGEVYRLTGATDPDASAAYIINGTR